MFIQRISESRIKLAGFNFTYEQVWTENQYTHLKMQFLIQNYLKNIFEKLLKKRKAQRCLDACSTYTLVIRQLLVRWKIVR